MSRMEDFRGLSFGAVVAGALDVMRVVEAPAGFPAGRTIVMRELR